MKVGILGATGAVGQQMLKCLEEKDLAIDELRLLASSRSVGKEYQFKGQTISVIEANDDSFEGLDYVLGATENDLAIKFAPFITKQAIFIDNSSAFRLNQDVPLVVPEINPEDAYNNKGIIANPNCSTIISCMAINAINQLSEITAIIASTYQAVSGAGINGIKELEQQNQAIINHQPLQSNTFPYQIAYNCIPQIGSFNSQGYSSEEMKLQNESRKIMHLPNLKATCTCVRVPVLQSHSISLSIQTKNKLTIEQVREAEAKMPGVHLVDDVANSKYPMPINTTNYDFVEVGRIREDLVLDNGIALWCCGDQLRKGAASNAIQIMELLIKK